MPRRTSTGHDPGLVWPLVLSGAVVLALAIGIAVHLTGDDPDQQAQAPGAAAAPGDDGLRELGESLARRDKDDPAALGDADAPVVLIAYSDYQCPFCAQWVSDVQPELVERYVEEGDLRIEWRDFPYKGEVSEIAAIGAHAAGEQGAFWDYHAAVYSSYKDLKGLDPAEAKEVLADIAEGEGIDPERFTADLERGALAERVDDDFAQGQGIGVSGTPAFLINGNPVIGAQPTEVFTETIDAALAEAG